MIVKFPPASMKNTFFSWFFADHEIFLIERNDSLNKQIEGKKNADEATS